MEQFFCINNKNVNYVCININNNNNNKQQKE